MGCCRSITSQIQGLALAKQRLARAQGGTRQTAESVTAHLDTIREVLGGYQVDDSLTVEFRCEVEPALCDVWTREDLAQYARRIHTFSSKIMRRLDVWQARYCKEKAGQRVVQMAQ